MAKMAQKRQPASPGPAPEPIALDKTLEEVISQVVALQQGADK